MAHLRIDGLDETIREMEKLGRMDETAPKAIDAASPLLETVTKAAVSSVIQDGTGALVKSIRKTKAKKNEYGYYATVKPTGKDQKGVSNSDKLMRLNYGTSKQLPRPCLQKAINAAKGPCIQRIEEIVAQEVGAE